MSDPSTPKIEQALEPGEKVIWSGRPDAEALCAGARKAPVFGNALRHYAESLSYAVTDRRLLILEDNVVTDQYFPGDLRQELALRPRSGEFQDLVFEQIAYDVNSDRSEILWQRAPDRSRVRTGANEAIRLEQAGKAFKALADAAGVQSLVKEWQEERLAGAREAAGGFVGGDPADRLTLRNPALGLSIDLPRDWEVLVRSKPVPMGKVGVDVEDWKNPAQLADWNALQAEGGLDAAVQLELVETPTMTLTARKAGGGLLFRLMGGRRLSMENPVSRGAYRGFAVTRLTPSQDREGPRMVQRLEVLHDGNRQFVLTSQWRQGAEELERLARAVADSVSLG
jgi:hypothetical protein